MSVLKSIMRVKDREKIIFLKRLGQLVLRKLNIRFTSSYLEDAITRSYYRVFEQGDDTSGESDKIEVADREDPCNLAIVLLKALKHYHIKSEVVESAIVSGESGTLIILTSRVSGTAYPQLLGWVEAVEEKDILAKFADESGTILRISEAAEIENFIILSCSELSAEPNYISNHNHQRLQRLYKVTGFFLAAGIGIFAVVNAIEKVRLILWAPLAVLFSVALFICYNLFKLEKFNDFSGKFLKRFCTSEKKGFDCRHVLGSGKLKFFGIISLTDTGIIYFITLFIFLLAGLSGSNYNGCLAILFWCSIAALPMTIISIYYQLVVIRKICPLCMLIQILLWGQFAYFILIGTEIDILSVQFPMAIQLLVIGAATASIYFLVLFNRKIRVSEGQLSLENFGYKNEIKFYNILANRQSRFDDPCLPGALILGNTESPLKLVVVLSLLCYHCGEKLKDLVRLSDWHGDDICIKIFLKADAPVKELLNEFWYYTTWNQFKQALDYLNTWYKFLSKMESAKGRDISFIVNRWKVKVFPHRISEKTEKIYDSYAEWQRKQLISFTPFITYNGHSLPGMYYDTSLLSDIIEEDIEQKQAS